VVAYPQIRDQPTWDHMAWGTITVFSDGTRCADAAPQAIAATPSTSTTTSLPAPAAAATGNAIRGQLPTGWLLMALANLGEQSPTD